MAAAETSTSLVQRTQQVIDTIQHPDFLEQIKDTLPENVSLDRFVRVATTAVRTDPNLVKADENSLFASIVKCAQDGLLPDGREAALVIYGGKVAYLPMIGGYRKIAADHGWSILTNTVRVGDAFEFEEGLEPKLTHRRAKPGERGELVNAYAIAQHRDGRKLSVVLDEDEVEKCRQVSRAKDNGPWQQWTERMWEKTAGKRLFKQLPIGDHELVERLTAADLIPDGATAAEMLYGPVREVPAVDPPATNTAATDDSTERQQATAADALSHSPASAAAVPGDDIEDSVFEPIEDDPATVTDDELAAAGAIKVTSGAWKDKTLLEIADAGDEGAAWLYVQLKKATPGSAKWQPLATVIRGRLPETWQAYEQWRETQA